VEQILNVDAREQKGKGGETQKKCACAQKEIVRVRLRPRESFGNDAKGDRAIGRRILLRQTFADNVDGALRLRRLTPSRSLPKTSRARRSRFVQKRFFDLKRAHRQISIHLEDGEHP
jgi:hypothetical protein